jgi:hypothetical protein
MTASPYDTPVSPELERELDSLAGLGRLRGGTTGRPAGDPDAYPAFIWFNGCYYCKPGAASRWYLRYCSRYQPDPRETAVRHPRAGVPHQQGSRLERRPR